MLDSSPEPPILNALLVTLGWASTLGGAVGLPILFFSRSAQDFFLAHPLWGWGLFAFLLITGPVTIQWRIQKRSNTENARLSDQWKEKEAHLSAQWKVKEVQLAEGWEAKNAELEARWEARLEALSREDWERDLPLLEDRMLGWEMDSYFHKYLQQPFHKHLPMQFVRALEEQVERWERDSRRLSNPEVAEVWGHCKDAAKRYIEKIEEYMWTEEDRDYLHVPPEWGHREPDRYQEAFRNLGKYSAALRESLSQVYRVQHSLTQPGSKMETTDSAVAIRALDRAHAIRTR